MPMPTVEQLSYIRAKQRDEEKSKLKSLEEAHKEVFEAMNISPIEFTIIEKIKEPELESKPEVEITPEPVKKIYNFQKRKKENSDGSN